MIGGSFQGYSRMLTNKGTCQLGYWKSYQPEKSPKSLPISIPWGKWCAFHEDGTFRIQEDFFVAE